MASVKYIARMSEERRLAVLTAFVKAQEVSALDEAVDVLDMLILDITRSAKNNGQKKRLRTLKDLDRAALLLARACALLLDENTDDAALRQAIFRRIPKDQLVESVDKVNELARPLDTNFQDEMVEQYGRVKRFLSTMLRDLHFQAAPAGEHTLSAIHYLAELNGSKKRILDDAPEQIISGPWKRLVYDKDGRILRAGYSLCLLERLQDSLRRRDIWLENSDRWGVHVRSYFKELNGRRNGSRYVGLWVIHPMELKQQNNWLRGSMKRGNQWLRALHITLRLTSVMRVSIPL